MASHDGTGKGRARPARWSDAEATSLVNQLHAAIENGETSENGFRRSVWERIANSFADPLKQNPRVAETKFSRMKRDFAEVRLLRTEVSGFSWNPEVAMVTAGPEVWKDIELVKKRSDLMKWKVTPFPWYDVVSAIVIGKANQGEDVSGFVGRLERPGAVDGALGADRYSLNGGAGVVPGADSEQVEIIAARSKRHRSASEPREQPPQQTEGPRKKQKKDPESSTIDAIALAVSALARACTIMVESRSAESRPPRPEQNAIHFHHRESATEAMDYQCRAQKKVQDEACLTQEGMIMMLDILQEENVARSYLNIKSDGLRVKWIKRQLQNKLAVRGMDEDMVNFWIDWAALHP